MKIYTDGSSFQSEGAWAYVIIDSQNGEKLVEYAAGFMTKSTNNRAELTAAIEGLKKFQSLYPLGSKVEIISDSAYLINCFKQSWYVKWEQKRWYGSTGPVKNPDLWKELLRIYRNAEEDVSWKHIRGHQGDKWNEVVDSLAGEMRLTKKLLSPEELGILIKEWSF